MKRSLTPPDSLRTKRSADLKEITRNQRGSQGVARISHVKHFFTFLLAEVGGRLQFVMLKYERTGPGRVKAHGRGLSVYFGL